MFEDCDLCDEECLREELTEIDGEHGTIMVCPMCLQEEGM